MRNLMVWSLLLGLAACASVKPLAVAPDKLNAYWLPAVSPPLEMVTFHGPVTACVLVEFTVSPSGKPHNLSAVTASQTEGPFVETALAHIRAQRFKPAPGNPTRVPATTRKAVNWVWEGWAQDNEVVLAKCAL